ncbi:hypothetical protein ACFQL1_23165 [Halomicroarcula sp. GCM10025709]|uniref:hypothetical protein n=1 Tax=Haloarcula TaxID=2237 RepID=UPI0024C3BDF0|nr:hypothetical protein [Halomicroarcula sp. YJ-61-S]
MAFDDLNDALDEQDNDDTDSSSDSTQSDTTETTTSTATSTETEPSGGPAFSFDDTKQDAIYARPSSLDELGDALAELDLELRNRGLRDVPKREKHDALARLAGNHIEELADLIEGER